MNTLRTGGAASGTAVRKTHWLAALEKELKSRVGWIDEAVSPFGGRRRSRNRARIVAPLARTEKAA
jgi:hypothetical protein